MKTALLLGDVVRDLNIMEYPPVASQHYQSLPTTAQVATPGGVLFLKELLRKAVPALGEPMTPARETSATAVDVFTAWKQGPKGKGAGDKRRLWWIDRVIGRSGAPGIDGTAIAAQVESAGKADLLVIESLGLGWLEALLAGGPSLGEKLLSRVSPQEVVLKLSSLGGGLPFASNPDATGKMTVVLSARALRERGAAISEGLSWDRTIEDTVKEFESGLSSLDLARCRRVVVLFSAEAAAVFERKDGASRARMEKFLFHPSQFEGSFKASHGGKMFGDLSVVTTAVVRSLVERDRYPLFVALSLALTAIRKQQEEGLAEIIDGKGRSGGKFAFGELVESPCAVLTLPERLNDKDAKAPLEALAGILEVFSCAFPHEQLDDPALNGQKAEESRLLRDATGCGPGYVAAKAFEIVMRGATKGLKRAPVASFGKYLTADREEIERINAIRKLMVAYRGNPKDTRPLSLAAFGPPGSGKSFSIKQLAEELGFGQKSMRTFNLSEFQDIQELHVAFHLVRDASVRGEIPLIFWDEFDTDKLRWLKEFLAPMQDAEFRAGSVIHPFGKAVFVFAGGVFTTFRDFELGTREEEPGDARPGGERRDPPDPAFKGKKAPDFISRLRGYVDIKGPNPSTRGEDNHEYLIRRAILLRSVLERTAGHLIAPDGQPAISAPVVQAFLRVKKYKHGARSLESLVTMSNLVNGTQFGESALPSDNLLGLHVEANDFRRILRESTVSEALIERIAEACHEDWKNQKEAAGYQYGPVRVDSAPDKRHPLCKPYRELDKAAKDGNRSTARLSQAKLEQVGLRVERRPSGESRAWALPPGKRGELVKIEHDIWMRDHLLGGYEQAAETVDALKLHKCVKRFAALSEEDQKLDEAIVTSLERAMGEAGYEAVASAASE